MQTTIIDLQQLFNIIKKNRENLLSQVKRVFTQNKIINRSQFGFSECLSTQHALFEFTYKELSPVYMGAQGCRQCWQSVESFRHPGRWNIMVLAGVPWTGSPAIQLKQRGQLDLVYLKTLFRDQLCSFYTLVTYQGASPAPPPYADDTNIIIKDCSSHKLVNVMLMTSRCNEAVLQITNKINLLFVTLLVSIYRMWTP